LYVLIPARAAPAVLTLLDATGRQRAGWPVELAGATSCDHLLPVDDGSVRVVCTLENPGNMFDPIGAFAFDATGSPVAGWPIDLGLDGYGSGRVIGDELTLHAWVSLGDVIEEGQPASSSWIMSVAADATVRDGARTVFMPSCCSTIGPDGVAYAILHQFADTPAATTSELVALDATGVRPGVPVAIEGIASLAAFDGAGRAHLTVGSLADGMTRVLVLDQGGTTISAGSSTLPMATVEYSEDTGGCTVGVPQTPLVGRDGSAFVYSELDTRVFALDSSQAVRPGWPFRPDAPLERARPGYESEHEAGYCPLPVPPAVGPDSTLYLPLEANDATIGGSIVAVGPDGRVRPGWPVELRRPGAEFWSVVVGPDGTVYALAIEPEAGDTSSASVLAIAPDSTVRWTTTIIEP
jgi:hypothetical protein